MGNSELVENYHLQYSNQSKFSRLANELLVERYIAPNLAGDSFAEMGISFGVFTGAVARYAKKMILVDGNTHFCQMVAEMLAGRGVEAAAHCCMFEDFDYGLLTQTSDVFLISMLHVLPGYWPVMLAKLARSLPKGARIHMLSSNAKAINRLLGHHMGMIKSLEEPDEVGKSLNTCYVADADLRAEADKLSLEVIVAQGYMCRPLPMSAMEPMIDRRAMELLFDMGQAMPSEFCNGMFHCLQV